MEYRSMSVPRLTIGLDLGDKSSHLFALSHDGEAVADRKVSTTRTSFKKHFAKFSAARVVIEAGSHSHWVNELLTELGHEVIVANPAALGNKRQRRKNDKRDAESLAFQGQTNPRELRPIRHRSTDSQVDLSVIRARDCLVRTRTVGINAVRGIVKTFGERLPSRGHSSTFAKRMRSEIPDKLKPVLEREPQD